MVVTVNNQKLHSCAMSQNSHLQDFQIDFLKSLDQVLIGTLM